MREIKFRAWDINNNTFLNLEWEDYYIDISTGEVYEIEEHSRYHTTYMHRRYLENVVLMQYTGLKDKNGKEVYEGDIIRCTSGCPHIVEWVQEHGGTFLGGMPTFYLSGINVGYAWASEEEIIGNIYANPELIP